MHVPLIANWPGHIRAGTNDDLIDSTDFLPTICAAAGAKVPSSLKIDGHSFWPQLMGEKGEPREWIYTWYAQDGVAPIREFVTTKEYKLYRSGRFYDLKKDPFEDNDPNTLADLTGDEAKAAAKLKAVLAQYADARPAAVAAKSRAAKKGGSRRRTPPKRRTTCAQGRQKRERRMRMLTLSKYNWIGARSASKGIFLALLIGSVTIAQTRQTSDVAALHRPPRPLLLSAQSDGTRAPIHTAADWQHRREQILAGMQEAMGPLPHPKSPVPLDVQILEEHKEDGYIRRKLAYHTDDPKTRSHAWLLLPDGDSVRAKTPGRPLPPSNNAQRQRQPRRPHRSPRRSTTRKELAKRGYVTLSPDYPSFGESKDYDFDADNYTSGTMKAIYDNTRAIDLLQSLPEVDPNRIGCIGHSLGGHNTLFTAAFDQRIKAAVTSCGFTSFHKYKGGNLTGWTSPRYMPLIKTKYKLSPDQMPFDFAEVIAAIAPRAVFVVAPLHDDNFDISGVHDVLNAARPIFKLLGHPDDLQAVHPDCAHDFLDAERTQAYEFLDRLPKRP